MFSVDDRIKSLPVTRDQVVSLFQSINTPHLAVPGRKAGPAQCFVVTLRGPSGHGVFVYLYLPESDEEAVYVSERRAVPPEQAPEEEGDAMAFAESMGFMMDNTNFPNYPPEEQDAYMGSLPVFQRDRGLHPPRPQVRAQSKAAQPQPGKPQPAALGKLFGAFALLAAVLVGPGCKHIPTNKEYEASRIHYDLGVQSTQENPQQAMMEFQKALELDAEFPEALNAKGLLLHVVFKKLDDAMVALKKAIELKPKFSEAKTNLGNLYMDLKRYDDAIGMYQEALGDILYATPYIAESNLGWAKYKKGLTEEAITHIKTAVTVNPRFCLGYRNLGTIYDETNQTAEACKQFGKYRENCGDFADAHMREGVCLAKLGQLEQARTALETCVSKAGPDNPLKEDCKSLKEKLSQ
jgi:type IV pilus assembly protein PilF